MQIYEEIHGDNNAGDDKTEEFVHKLVCKIAEDDDKENIPSTVL